MRFIVDSHIRMKDGFNFPTVGDEIEAEIQQDGSLDIPWFPLDEAVVTHNFPDNLRPGRIRIRVDAIETVRPNNSVDSLFYRFVVKRLDLTFIGAITV